MEVPFKYRSIHLTVFGEIGEAGYVIRYTDTCVGRPNQCRNREAVRKIFRKEYIWELV